MGGQKLLFIALGVIVIGFVGFVGFTLVGGNRIKQETAQNPTSQRTNQTNYVTYSPENLKNAQEKGRVILYFWASWCPTCRVLDQELKEKGSELPEDVTILQVNYDTEKELKKRYSIIQQHTLVQIDKDKNEVEKWIGGGVETIKQQLK